MGPCYVPADPMIVGSIPRRYARALFQLALEEGKVDPWARALSAVASAVAGSPELQDLIANPVYTASQRRAVLTRVAAALGLDPQPTALLALLCDRGRLAALPGVVRSFGALADAASQRVRARIVSAIPLAPGEEQALAARLAAATRAQVVLESSVDPELLGGVVAHVGDLTFDGSLRTQLEDLRQTLKR